MACSEKEHYRTVDVMSNTEGPSVPDFDLRIEEVAMAMHKISGRSWGLLGFSHPLCAKEILPLSYKFGWDRTPI